MLHCPNCDGILNKAGCQACGWKHGDPHSRDLAKNPFKPEKTYGSHAGAWEEHAKASEAKPEPEAEPEAEPEPVADPVEPEPKAEAEKETPRERARRTHKAIVQ